MSASCSAPVTSRGAGTPAARDASVTISNANDATDRASGPAVARPSRTDSASRSRVAVVRIGVSTSTSAGSQPRSRMRSATSSMMVVVLPVPGAPSTAADAESGRSTTARWLSSR